MKSPQHAFRSAQVFGFADRQWPLARVIDQNALPVAHSFALDRKPPSELEKRTRGGADEGCKTLVAGSVTLLTGTLLVDAYVNWGSTRNGCLRIEAVSLGRAREVRLKGGRGTGEISLGEWTSEDLQREIINGDN